MINALGKNTHFSRMKNGHIAIATKDKVMVWDYKSKKLFSSFSHNISVVDVTINDDFIAVHDGYKVQIFEKTGENIHEITLRKKQRHFKRKGKQKFCDPVAISFGNNENLRIDVDGYARDYSVKDKAFLPYEYATQTNKYKFFSTSNSCITITKDNKLTVRHFENEHLTHLKPIQLAPNLNTSLSDFDRQNVVVASEDEIYMWKMKRVMVNSARAF